MFNPKTEKIKKLSDDFPGPITQMNSILNGDVNMYIDYANVRPWSAKLNWNI